MAEEVARFIQAMEKLVEVQSLEKVNTVHDGQLLLQPGGMFAIPNLDNAVISTMVRPLGLGSILPSFSSDDDDPRYGLLTGVSDDIGNEPTDPCDDAPTGYIKGATLTAAWGHVMRKTMTIEPSKILRRRGGVTTNLQLIGEMFGNTEVKPNMSDTGMLDLVVKSEMVNVGVRIERKFANMIWQGDPANNTAGGGYREFPGLDSQIATGQIDAESGVVVPSADSFILDFNYNAIDGTAVDIVAYLSEAMYHLEYIAETTGLSPCTWILCLRRQLWEELTATWPCRYMTNRCSNIDGSNPVIINDDNNIRMRDDMRNSRTIAINGRKYPVVVDDGIFEHNNINNANVPEGSYASSINIVPLRINGNFPVTYWQFIDYTDLRNRELTPLGQGARHLPFWTDGGRFLWGLKWDRFCFDLQAKVEPRIVLRAPQLAGKIQNILYTPLVHLRDWDPASPYHVDGGTSIQKEPSSYAVWS